MSDYSCRVGFLELSMCIGHHDALLRLRFMHRRWGASSVRFLNRSIRCRRREQGRAETQRVICRGQEHHNAYYAVSESVSTPLLSAADCPVLIDPYQCSVVSATASEANVELETYIVIRKPSSIHVGSCAHYLSLCKKHFLVYLSPLNLHAA